MLRQNKMIPQWSPNYIHAYTQRRTSTNPSNCAPFREQRRQTIQKREQAVYSGIHTRQNASCCCSRNPDNPSHTNRTRCSRAGHSYFVTRANTTLHARIDYPLVIVPFHANTNALNVELHMAQLTRCIPGTVQITAQRGTLLSSRHTRIALCTCAVNTPARSCPKHRQRPS